MADSTIQKFMQRLASWVGPRRLAPPDARVFSRQLTPQSYVPQRLFFSDIEEAVSEADRGNLTRMGQIAAAMRNDGALYGQLVGRYDGLVQLPKHFEGPDSDLCALVRSEFDSVFDARELSAMAQDGGITGVMFGEFIEPRPGYIHLVRRNPEFLQYRYDEDRWYLRSREEGLVPVDPNNGRWVLGFHGGRETPWKFAMFRALARAYLSKDHAIFFRDEWNHSMAHPAKVASYPQGATFEEAQLMLADLTAWASNTGVVLPAGWKVDLLQATGQGFEAFQKTIDAADQDIILTINGQIPTTTGGNAFGNTAIHQRIRNDLVQSDANSLAHLLNEQAVWVFVNIRRGFDAMERSPRVSWDTTLPKDQKAEADAANTAAAALKGWIDALRESGSAQTVDVARYAEKFGIPLCSSKQLSLTMPHKARGAHFGSNGVIPLVRRKPRAL